MTAPKQLRDQAQAVTQDSAAPDRRTDRPCPFCDDGGMRERFRVRFGDQLPGTYVIRKCDRCASITGLLVEKQPPPRPTPRATTPVRWDGDLGDLRRIPSAHFVPALAAVELAGQYVRCPLHADNTPSLHVRADDAGWFCHGCGRGGGVFEFWCALQGRDVPSDPNEFARMAAKVTEALRRAT
jgi:hypothetical protein